MSKTFACEPNSRYSTSSRWHQEPLSTHSRHTCAITNDLDTPLHHQRGSYSRHDDPPHSSPHRHHRSCASVSPRSPITDPDINVNGLSQAEYQNKWWQHIHETPTDQGNPLKGGNPFFQIGSVLALVGLSSSDDPSGGVVERNIALATGTTLFIPVLNTTVDEAGMGPWTAEDSRIAAKAIIDTVSIQCNGQQGIFFRVDGRSLIQGEDWIQYRQSSDEPFSFTVPPRNSFDSAAAGYTPGLKVKEAIADGYTVMLAPLSVGTHTIEFGGSIDYRELKWDQNCNNVADTAVEQALKGLYDYAKDPKNHYTPFALNIRYNVTVSSQVTVPTNLDLSALAS